MFGKKVNNIKQERITKNVIISNQPVTFVFPHAKTGEYDGNKILLDEDIINDEIVKISDIIAQHKTTYNPIPTEIIISCTNTQANNAVTANTDNRINEVIETYEPRYSFDSIALSSSVLENIRTAISMIKHSNTLENEWGLGDNYAGKRALVLNFYGKPGTGKSITAEAVAKDLGKKICRINYSELESKYVGETSKNIKKAFSIAQKEDAVLIFEEADSFLGKRLTSVTQSADYGVNITRSVLLMELEKFSGVVIFTTNLIKNYDHAFRRRILLSVFFDMPDFDARKRIWEIHIGKKLPLAHEISLELLAKQYEDISGADIKDIVFFAALITLENKSDKVCFDSFNKAYSMILERYSNRDDELETRVIESKRITKEQYLMETGETDA